MTENLINITVNEPLLNEPLNNPLNDIQNDVHIDINDDTEEDNFLFKSCLNKKYKIYEYEFSIMDMYCRFIGLYAVFMVFFFILVVTPYVDWNVNTKILSFLSVMLFGLSLTFLACYIHNRGKNTINFRFF